MSTTEILFARKKLKSLPTVYDKTKTDARERKRNVLYLIRSYLREQNLVESAEILEKEALLNSDFEICENVDLEIILQEYQSYYYTKFQKYPKIVKKLEEPSKNNDKIKRKNSATKKEIIQNDKTETLDFPFEIKPLNNEQNTKNEEIHLKEKEYNDSIDFDVIPTDMKDMAEQIKKEFITTKVETTWDDCIGLYNVKEKLKEATVYPLIYPDLFENLVSWKGVLLFGPPGTGKTLLAKALASEGNSTFINVTSSTFISKWRGESEKMIKLLFQMARKYAPTTIFIDEIDALANQLCVHEASKRFKSELLTQIDGVHDSITNVFVLGSTNSPWNIDPALLRRFEKRLLVPLPDEKAREDLLNKYLCTPNEIYKKDLQHLAKLTYNFSGSDIRSLCKEANMVIVREKISEINIKGGNNKTDMNLRMLNVKDVEKALGKISSCVKDEDSTKYFKWNKEYGSW